MFAYFPNREALVEAILDEVGCHFLAITEASFGMDRSLPERFASVLEAIAARSKPTRIMASSVRSVPKEKRAGLELHPDDLAHLVLGAGEMMLRLQLGVRDGIFDASCITR